MIEDHIPIRIIPTFVISYSCIKRKSSSQSPLYFGHWLVKGNTTCQLSTSCEIISFGKFQFNISFEFLNWSFSVLADMLQNGIWPDSAGWNGICPNCPIPAGNLLANSRFFQGNISYAAGESSFSKNLKFQGLFVTYSLGAILLSPEEDRKRRLLLKVLSHVWRSTKLILEALQKKKHLLKLTKAPSNI